MTLGEAVRRLALAGVLGGAMLYGAAANAADTGFKLGEGLGTISPTVDFTTNYVFRGISQTRREPAVQGTLEYPNEIGPVTPYIGTFMSNVKFPNTAGRDNLDIKIEQDLYGGLRWETYGLNWDIGYIRYRYPSTNLPANNSLSPD